MIAHFFIGFGFLITFFGVLGAWILPDLLLRFHAATKCGVTGTATILIGLMLHTGTADFIVRLLLIIVFTFVSSPLIAQVLAVSYFRDQNRLRDGSDNGA